MEINLNIAINRYNTACQKNRGLSPITRFELADEGFRSPFEQLVACIISIRTYDEVILPTARRLFALARTPAELSHLIPAQIDEQIGTCTFHEAKARQIHQIACRVVVEYGGTLQ